jgi:hypothetical protein
VKVILTPVLTIKNGLLEIAPASVTENPGSNPAVVKGFTPHVKK